MKVLFVTSEAHPLIKTGGLADVSGSLPAALRRLGVDVRILLPGYEPVMEHFHHQRALARLDPFAGIHDMRLLSARMPDNTTPLYILDAPKLYQRGGRPYQDPEGQNWPDNATRFGVLSRVAASMGEQATPFRWKPDLIHCNDWQSGLTPAYLAFARNARARSIMSVHNLAFQGVFPPALMKPLALPSTAFNMHGLEFHGQLSFMKAGLYYADHITTVSPHYAHEIQTPAYGCGLDGLLKGRQQCLTGILNGIDTDDWDPATDRHLAGTYSASNLAGKAMNKNHLQQVFGLACEPQTPLLGLVSRLTQQKGIDLIIAVAEHIINLGCQLVILGSGDRTLEQKLLAAAANLPGRMGVAIEYNEDLAHLIEAGIDMFLMPSRFEPCGLNQMYSMRYGAPPVVRRTGGLIDSVTDTNKTTLENGTATGFCFDPASSEALLSCLQRALLHYRDQAVWKQIQLNGMHQDFSWDNRATHYLDLYKRVLTTD